ncbi:MAG: biotin--[acetyl-CoA-carboxylase] ligase [Faecalibacterium sp.]
MDFVSDLAAAQGAQAPVLLEGTLNHVLWLPECDSTNRYAKAHFEEFGKIGAVFTTSQTAGRGRLGRNWENAAGDGLYYTVAIAEPLAQPNTLPLFASLAVCNQLKAQYGLDCQIKWPNDILVGGKKICGILCEGIRYGEGMAGIGIVCGIGINLCQTAAQFAAQGLPHATSLQIACPDCAIASEAAAPNLARALTDFGFDRALYTFAREGFAPYRDAYRAACVNLGKAVTFDLPNGAVGSGKAVDIDATGQLVVQTEDGETNVFTGEVSVKGIYGAIMPEKG